MDHIKIHRTESDHENWILKGALLKIEKIKIHCFMLALDWTIQAVSIQDLDFLWKTGLFNFLKEIK